MATLMTSRPRFEFRSSTRTSLEVPATILVSGQDEMQATTGNVSEDGFFVALPKSPPVGTMVKFALDLDGRVVRGFSEVVWIRQTQKNSEQPAGMGLQFRHFLDDGEVILRRLLSRPPIEELLRPS